MSVLRVLRYRTRALLRGVALDRDVADEMAFHLELAQRAHEAQGLSPREARRRALLEFGGLAQQQERVRDARGMRWVHELLQDLRYGLRLLRRAPVFTGVAVLSLGLGIGANTAIFSLVNSILLGSLPVPNPQELREIKWRGLSDGFNFTGTWDQPGPDQPVTADGVSYAVFEAIRRQSAGQGEVFGFHRLPEVTAAVGGPAFHASGLMVSANYFEGLQVGASRGRVFTSRDGAAESAGWAVISHAMWQQRLGGDAGVLGRTISLNGQAFVIIGVLPPPIRGLFAGDHVDLYVPLAAQPALRPGYDLGDAQSWWLALMARLHPGVSDSRFKAAAELAFVNAAGPLVRQGRLLLDDGRGGLRAGREHYRRPLLLLLGIVGVVILVACANLASLSLARGVAREPEFAVRGALGGERARLLRQSLTESVLLGLLGIAAAVPVALVAKTWLLRLLAGQVGGSGSESYQPPLDARVLAFTVVLGLLAAVLSGSGAAIRSAGVDPAGRLRERGATGGARLKGAKVLIVGQVALSLVLLTGAALYARTLVNIARIDPGFDADNLLVFRVDPAKAGYSPQNVTAFYDDVAAELAAIPGVRGVTLSREALLTGGMSGGPFTLPDLPGRTEQFTMAYRHTVDEQYFATMDIALLLGRGFRRSDSHGSPPVVIVNEVLVRRYLAGIQPVGARISMDGNDWTIIGVAGNAKYTDVREDVPPTVYFSFRQRPMEYAHFAVRTAGSPRGVLPAVGEAVRRVDAGLPLAAVATQTEMEQQRIAQQRLFAYLCGALAALALLLCCIGIYGLMAYNVSRRTGEVGVRVALGATRRQIARPVLRDALLLATVGIALGVPLALALVRLVKAQLYGVEPVDPASITAAGAVLAAVALLAAWLPARRAARIDPADALRSE